MVILSGSSNPDLARAVAKKLGAPLAERTLDRFPNNEVRVRLEENVVGKVVIVVQSLSPPVHDHLMELLLLADAARRQAARIVMAVVPWLAYSKQDKVFRPGEPLSARVVSRMISTSAVKRLYLMELHNPGIQGFFDIPTYQLSFKDVFVAKLKPELKKNTIVVAPDFGGITRSREFADLLGAPLVYLDKTRNLSTGRVRIHRSSRSIDGQHCVLFDDMILTGATAIRAASYLVSHGAASVTFCATHGLFSNGWEPFEGMGFSEILVSDSVPLPEGAPKYVRQISAAGTIAKALREMVY